MDEKSLMRTNDQDEILEITNNLNGKQFGKFSRKFDRDLFYYTHSYKAKWKVLKEGEYSTLACGTSFSQVGVAVVIRGPFLETPGNLSGPKSNS